MAWGEYKDLKQVRRFLNDMRVDVKVMDMKTSFHFDGLMSYRIVATWSDEDVRELARLANAESREYWNISPTLVDIYNGRIDFDVSAEVLKSLKLEVTK